MVSMGFVGEGVQNVFVSWQVSGVFQRAASGAAGQPPGRSALILSTNLVGHVLRGCHYSTSFPAVDASLHELADLLLKRRDYFSFRASRGPEEVDLKSVILFWEVRPVMAIPGFSTFHCRFKRGAGRTALYQLPPSRLA